MGFWSRFLGIDSFDAAQRVLAEPYEPFMGTGGIPVADPGYALFGDGADVAAVEALWKSQPNVRKVVDFCARNIASIPLHVFERVSDTDRRRITEGPLARAASSPAPRTGSFRFWHGVLSDALLYDRWAVLKAPRADGAGVDLVPIPSWRLRLDVDALRRVTGARYWVGDQAQQPGDVNGYRPLDLDLLVFDHGYSPKTAGMSPLETLRDILGESAEAVHYRRQTWANGARVPGYIYRPREAPEWSKDARGRWADSFRQAYTGDGSRSGGLPLMEDGMELRPFTAFSPQDTQDLEGRRLTAIEVAAAYHIAPELVGAQQGNYSNVREFRQMLYRDSLGAYIVAWEQALQEQLVPDLAAGRRLYIEANVESKLRGSFEDQAQTLSAAVGAPYMTRGEARGRMNLPEIDGADQLVVPLNVLIGGQASPRDSAPPASGTASREPGRHAKARAPETMEEKAAQVLAAFFARQGRAVASRAGAGEEAWDDERWNRELADELLAVGALVATAAGRATLEAMGLDVDTYDEERTLAWLRAAAEGVAEGVNGRTKVEVEQAIADDEDGDPAAAVVGLFAGVVAGRVKQIATTHVTAMSGFGTSEAVQQIGARGTKTWRVRSKRPRRSHARMDGETVQLGETFSNGARWPGDSKLDDDERSGCTCTIEIARE